MKNLGIAINILAIIGLLSVISLSGIGFVGMVVIFKAWMNDV